MKCSSCGMEFEGVFCPNCGTKNEVSTDTNEKIDAGMGAGQSFTMERPKKKKNIMAILALISGLASVCTLGTLIIPDILAIIFGIFCKQDEERPTIGKVGLICGILSAVIFVILMIVGIVLSN